jgi:hypothetical protein
MTRGTASRPMLFFFFRLSLFVFSAGWKVVRPGNLSVTVRVQH